MKNNSLPPILLGVLAISALASVVLCMVWISNVREIRSLQAQVAAVQNNRAVATQVAAELVEYSRRNPGINPLLESFGLKAKSQPSGSTSAPQNPTTK